MAYRPLFCIVLSVFVLTVPGLLHAQADSIQYKEGTLVLTPFFAYATCSSFFDATGKAITRQPSQNDPNDYVNEYSIFDFGIRASYALNDDVLLRAEIPYSYHLLHEYYLSGSSISGAERNRYSASNIGYYALGMEYTISRKRSATSLLLGMRSAPVFSPRSDSIGYYPLLPDGAMTLTAGIHARTALGNTRLSALMAYQHRTALLRDQIQIKADVELSTIPGTSLHITGDFLQSVSSMKNQNFNTQRMPVAESYVALGAGFSTMIGEELIAAAAYDVRIFGASTWALGRIVVSCGYILR